MLRLNDHCIWLLLRLRRIFPCDLLQLTAGQAEIFGTALIMGQALVLRGHKVAVCAARPLIPPSSTQYFHPMVLL